MDAGGGERDHVRVGEEEDEGRDGDDVTQDAEEEDPVQEDDDEEDDDSVGEEEEDEEEEEEDDEDFEDHPAEMSSEELVCGTGEVKPAEEEEVEEAAVSESVRKRMRVDKDGAVWEYEADCPVCMEHWTEEGHHQSCSLKCGHTFGRSCIEKWIRDWKKNKCPKCKRHCKISDIRPIYPKRIAVVEKVLLKDLEIIRAEKRVIEEKVKDQATLLEAAHLEVERMYKETEKYVSFARDRVEGMERRMNAIEEKLDRFTSK